MKKENVSKKLISFSLPLILSGILQQLYNWAGAFIVGHVEGEGALAAIGATVTITDFFLLAVNGFTLGLSILAAQKYGHGETDLIHKILSSFVVILGVISLVAASVGVNFSGQALRLLHTPEDIFSISRGYLRIIFIGVPFIAVYNVYSAMLRAIGNSKAPFFAVLISSVVNVLLDVLFVAVLRWGVRGAAIATVISQAAMAVFIIIYSVVKHKMLRFRFNRNLVNRGLVKESLKISLPPMLQSSVTAGGNLILQNFMNGFGTHTVAAVTTAYRIDTIMLFPIINLGSAISTMTAQSKGAGEPKLIKKFLNAGIVMMIVVSLLLTAIVCLFGGSLIAMFGVEAEAVAIGRNFFRSISAFYIFFGVATAIRGAIEGVGDVLYSSIAGILTLVIRIVLSYALKPYFDNMVIAYAEGLCWVVMLLIYLPRAVHKRHELGINTK